MAYRDDYSNNDNEEHIPRTKLQPIKKKKKNKPSYPTVKETSLKATNNKETNKKEKVDTMDTR